MIDVCRVTTGRERRAFVRFPYSFYEDNPCWVPPLRMLERERFNLRRNPFFEHADVQLFLARRGREVVGRVAAVEDRRHTEVHGERLATFGCFEAADAETAGSLLQSVEAWAESRGLRTVRGPLNLSLNEAAGLLIDGFESPPMILMPYNPPEYAEYLEQSGYAKVKDLYAWSLDRIERPPERIAALVERIRRRMRATIRTIDMRRFNRELEALLAIYCRAWQDNWGFVPPTKRETEHTIASLRWLVDPRWVLCAEIDGQIGGFLAAVPDLNQALVGTGGRLFPSGWFNLLTRRRRINQYRLLLGGVLPEYRQTGLLPLLLTSLIERGREEPWQRLEVSWVLEDNLGINGAVTAVGAERRQTYRIYEKDL